MTLDKEMTLEDYFHVINKENQDMPPINSFTDESEEPLTDVYFSIRTPTEAHYPSGSHTMSMQWQDGASWHNIIWEILKVLEASYGYSLKEKVFFRVHNEDVIEVEEMYGNSSLAEQMFVKDIS